MLQESSSTEGKSKQVNENQFLGPEPSRNVDLYYYRPQRSWGKVMLLQVSVILLTGESTWHPLETWSRPPRPGTPPRDQVHPPGADTPPRPGTPPGPGTLPRTRYTPLGPGTSPQDQVHPPGTRYTPLRTRYPPPGPGTPPDQVHPPRCRACWEIRSMSGRYASYWNAILLWFWIPSIPLWWILYLKLQPATSILSNNNGKGGVTMCGWTFQFWQICSLEKFEFCKVHVWSQSTWKLN